MKIGDKRIVTNEPPYGMFGINSVGSVKFITIEVIEEKEGKGEFSGKTCVGFLGKGSDGRLYGYNYPTMNESFNNTIWIPYISEENFKKLSIDEKDAFVKDYHWFDVTTYQVPKAPKFIVDFDILEFCQTHQHLFYKNDGCWRCNHNLKMDPDKVIKDQPEYRWQGWF